MSFFFFVKCKNENDFLKAICLVVIYSTTWRNAASKGHFHLNSSGKKAQKVIFGEKYLLFRKRKVYKMELKLKELPMNFDQSGAFF